MGLLDALGLQQAAVADVFKNDPLALKNGIVIWPGASVDPDAIVGTNCTISRDVHIGRRVVVGNNCKIQNGAQLFEGVELADHVFIGPHVVFTNVVNPRAFVSRRQEFKPTHVGRGASIGANATIRCGVTIGAFAMIGAGAVAIKDVPMYAVMVGVPAKRVGWACSCGEPIGTHHGILRFEQRVCWRCCAEYTVTSSELTVQPWSKVVHKFLPAKTPPEWCADVVRTEDMTCALCSKPYSKHPYCHFSELSESMRSSTQPEYCVHVTCDGRHVKL